MFAKDASIYWHAGVDNGIAHQVGGRIRNKWGDLGWESAALGYPITDELKTPDGKGRFNHFQGGSIYWSPETDAHQVWGGIRDKWAQQGWETGELGKSAHALQASSPCEDSDTLRSKNHVRYHRCCSRA